MRNLLISYLGKTRLTGIIYKLLERVGIIILHYLEEYQPIFEGKNNYISIGNILSQNTTHVADMCHFGDCYSECCECFFSTLFNIIINRIFLT